MKLLPTQTDKNSLTSFGEEARVMLTQHDYSGLAKKFGYALAYDREPAAAIEIDFLEAAASPYNAASDTPAPTVIKYFRPNSTGLFALVECSVPVSESATVLLELIITEKGEEKYITVEDISGVTA